MWEAAFQRLTCLANVANNFLDSSWAPAVSGGFLVFYLAVIGSVICLIFAIVVEIPITDRMNRVHQRSTFVTLIMTQSAPAEQIAWLRTWIPKTAIQTTWNNLLRDWQIAVGWSVSVGESKKAATRWLCAGWQAKRISTGGTKTWLGLRNGKIVWVRSEIRGRRHSWRTVASGGGGRVEIKCLLISVPPQYLAAIRNRTKHLQFICCFFWAAYRVRPIYTTVLTHYKKAHLQQLKDLAFLAIFF
jgi:hypothetical protein